MSYSIDLIKNMPYSGDRMVTYGIVHELVFEIPRDSEEDPYYYFLNKNTNEPSTPICDTPGEAILELYKNYGRPSHLMIKNRKTDEFEVYEI
jgi:hypothetical protein